MARPLESIQPTGSGTRLLFGISVLWFGLSVGSDGLTALVLPTQVDAVVGRDSRATTLGLVVLIGVVAGMLVQPLAGAWSDRLRAHWGRRGTIGIGVGASVIALGLLAIGRTLPIIVGGFVAVSVAMAVAQSAQQGFIPDLIKPERRGMAAGWKGFMDVAGATVGFVVLGALLSEGEVPPALAMIAAVLVATFLLTFIGVRDERSHAGASALPRMTAAFRIDRHAHPIFVRLVASRFLFLLGTFAVGRFFVFFVEDRMGLARGDAAEQAGAVLGVLALLTAVTAPPAGWLADRVGRLPVMWFGAFSSVIGVLGLIAAGSGVSILGFGALMSLGSASFATSNWAQTADVVPADEGARFFGLANFGTAGPAAAAGLFGLLVDAGNRDGSTIGYTLLFISAAVAFMSSLLMLRGLPNTRHVSRSTAANEASGVIGGSP